LGELWLGGRLHYIAGASDERAENKIRGMTIGGWYGDEITLYPQSFFKMGLSRMSVTGARAFFTTNPDSPLHYIKKEFLDREAELNLIRWQFRLEDNLSLPPEYVKALKQEYTGLFYKRFIDGLWCMAEGAIFDMINPDLHYVPELPKLIKRAWIAGDYGTTNPLHFVYIVEALDNTTLRPDLYVADELRFDSKLAGRQKTDQEYSEMLRDWMAQLPVPPERVFVDPSAASFIVQLYKDQVRGVTQANNDVLDGIRYTSSLLANQRLKFVDSKVPRTIDDMMGYVWDTKAQDKGEDKPVKVADHGADALRYGVAGIPQVWRNWLAVNRLRPARRA
jgi:PBSX family phage terminase large subunit